MDNIRFTYILLFSLVNYNFLREVSRNIERWRYTQENSRNHLGQTQHFPEILSDSSPKDGLLINMPACIHTCVPLPSPIPFPKSEFHLWLLWPTEQGGIDAASFSGLSEDLEFHFLSPKPAVIKRWTPLSETIMLWEAKSPAEALEDEANTCAWRRHARRHPAQWNFWRTLH